MLGTWNSDPSLRNPEQNPKATRPTRRQSWEVYMSLAMTTKNASKDVKITHNWGGKLNGEFTYQAWVFPSMWHLLTLDRACIVRSTAIKDWYFASTACLALHRTSWRERAFTFLAGRGGETTTWRKWWQYYTAQILSPQQRMVETRANAPDLGR